MGDKRKDVLKDGMGGAIMAAWNKYKGEESVQERPGPDWHSCGELAKLANLTRPGMAHRLEKMLAAGIVERRKGWPADWWRVRD